MQIRLSSLRQRGEDVVLLADYFLKTFGVAMNKTVRGISRPARQKLLMHHWPGNVRELRNVVERALILETKNEIQSESLPDFQLEAQLHQAATPKAVSGGSLDEIMGNFERELISSMLEQNRYNLGRTAEQLKISRHALRYRMQRLNLAIEVEDETSSVTKDQSR